MDNGLIKTQKRLPGRMFQIGLCFVLLTMVAGCMGNYGRIKRDSDVFQAFENNQVPAEYRYYYFGFANRPYAVIGVESKYDAGSNLWREVEPNTEQFKQMTFWIWEDYGYYRFGAQILDPAGNQVGILYSSIREVAVKFPGDNRMVVMPHTPFLWGPEANMGRSGRYFGRLD